MIDIGAGLHDLSVPDVLGELREFLLLVPDRRIRGLAVLFHPFGSRPELVLQGGTDGDYLLQPLTGAAGSAQTLGLAVLAPRSRGRSLDGVSLAWKGHLDAVWQLSESLRDRFGLSDVSAGGLSMGGLEALVFAGQHPDGVRAVWATNPIVDLAGWYRDLSAGGSPDKLEIPRLIADELGGSPAEMSAEYRARSPFDYIEGLARVRVRISWSPADTVIPHQRTVHSHRLATQLLKSGGDVDEVIVTHTPVDSSIDGGRVAHEGCDVREAMGWLAEALDTSHGAKEGV